MDLPDELKTDQSSEPITDPKLNEIAPMICIEDVLKQPFEESDMIIEVQFFINNIELIYIS